MMQDPPIDETIHKGCEPMDNERLEEIKHQVRDHVSYDEQEDIWDIANELIDALEESRKATGDKHEYQGNDQSMGT